MHCCPTKRNAQDTFYTLCVLYGGPERAQALMKNLHGATQPIVVRFSQMLLVTEEGRNSVVRYNSMSSLPHGYGRLMHASGNNRTVRNIVNRIGGGKLVPRKIFETSLEVAYRLLFA